MLRFTDVANPGLTGEIERAPVDARLNAQSQAIAERIDLIDYPGRITAPAHYVQHRSEYFLTNLGDAFNFDDLRRQQIR